MSPLGDAVISCAAGTSTVIITDDRTVPAKSTLYPKISKLSDFLYKCKRVAPETRIIPIVGTVKLHGAHVDWVISRDDSIRVQSRNMLELAVGNDNYGFAAFSNPIRDVILRLKEGIVHRYMQLNPDRTVDLDHPVIISGEWCGQSVQKGVAVSQLPRHFVIISIRINDTWVSETEYADIHDESNGIYHIGKAGCYRLDLDTEDIDPSEAAIQAIVTDVEKTCPYGLTRNVTGRGEGIVWKACNHMDTPEMWFKYKGDSTAVSHNWKHVKGSGTVKGTENAGAADDREREYNFARSVVTERRLEQGLEYLAETGTARKGGLGEFLGWVTNDVLVEEKKEMTEMNIGRGRLKPAIRSIANTWYNQKLIEDMEEEKNELETLTEKMKNTAA
ncbi:MAG: hypothetical protein L6R42_000505 [Xanthoria sp. 1 TBL-2021]|nr:MAG: hypothetical protein L6R42_000505 [Xanthoria sp. 1 TBL-2021]